MGHAAPKCGMTHFEKENLMAKTKTIAPAPALEEPTAPEELTIPSGHVIFVVTEKISSLAYEGKSYPVVNGKVSLPAVETWYDELIQAGILKLS